MFKIAILGPLQQQASALSTQFSPLYVLYDDRIDVRYRDEMNSSGTVVYKKYSESDAGKELFVLRELLREVAPTVIYANGFRHLWMVGLMIREPGLFPKRPIILVTSHNSWSWQNAFKRIAMGLSCHLLADGIVTLGSFQERWLRKLGLSRLRMRTIPNAVNVDQFAPAGPADYFAGIFTEKTNFPVLVNIANINKSKGQDVLIRSVSLVKKQIESVRLVLLGSYSANLPYASYLRGLIAELGLDKNVFLLGKVDHGQIPWALRSSDISIISSWSEACPFILLESLAVGKVTISTAVGGIPDIIKDGYNGFLVDPGDSNAMADDILKVSRDASLRMSIEERARTAAIDKYSFDVIGSENKDFLLSIMRRRKHSS